MSENYQRSKEVLNSFDKNDLVYYWYKIKKIAQIISIEKNENESIDFIEKNFVKIKKPNYKIYFDLANIYKNFSQYEKSIMYYNLVLQELDNNSLAYADALYRRGSCYERIGDYKNSDKDLLDSLKVKSDDPFVLNYLAYSWLERNYKVAEATQMLKKAYLMEKDNPYIIDSIGWAYFLTKNYIQAEKYMRQAIQIRPNDPVIIDHYADILWKLDRKLEARYFWKEVLKLEHNEEINKQKVKKKMLRGLK